MAFEGLSEKLQAVIRKVRGTKHIDESALKETLREVRLALLEADVNFKVVKEFCARIKERALGQEVDEHLTAGQHIIKVVHEELITLLGGKESKLTVASKPPTIIMLCGLQGAGKTTTIGKLANKLRKDKKKPLMVAADIYRPAAIAQLQTLGRQLNIPVFSLGSNVSPVEIARQAIAEAQRMLYDTVLIDTAGRLHIDEVLMQELRNIKDTVHPHEILLTVDAMTGQDAVTVAKSFHEALDLTGLIVTKLDGDARGGAILSVKEITGCPVKYVGMGEKLDALDVFHPERMASRILGMGDVLSLIEKAQEVIDEETALKMAKSIKNDDYSLEQFLAQMQQVKKLGSLESILSMIPGMGNVAEKLKEANISEKEFDKVEAIIRSMTPKERQDPSIINGSRRRRIAAGSGNKVQDVNKLLNNFEQSKKMLKQMKGLTKYASKSGLKRPLFRQ